jgi:hypothetical protein
LLPKGDRMFDHGFIWGIGTIIGPLLSVSPAVIDQIAKDTRPQKMPMWKR